MKKTAEKTNVMRILDRSKVDYSVHSYVGSGAISGVEVAEALDENPAQVFKTLVTTGASKTHYVFLVPVARELNLKTCAGVVGEKSIEMLKMKDLLPLTGYIHGGCSPIGIKKQFKTIIDVSAQDFYTIMISAGKLGYQIELSLGNLAKVIDFELAKL